MGVIAAISSDHSGLDARGNQLQIGDLITWTVFSSDPNSANYQPEIPQKNDKIYKYGHRQITEMDDLHGGLATISSYGQYLHTSTSKRYLSCSSCHHQLCCCYFGRSLRLAETITKKNIHVAGIGLLGLVSIAMCKEWVLKVSSLLTLILHV